MEIGTGRAGEDPPQRLADADLRHTPHQLAGEEAVGVHVVAVRAARLPVRTLGCERGADPGPVVERLIGHRVAQRGQAGPVREQRAHGGRAFVRRRELGPHVLDRRVEREIAALDEREREHRDHALAHRVRVHQRVGAPRHGARGVAVPAPQIDHAHAVDHHAQSRPDLVEVGKVRRERFAQRAEARVAGASDRRGCARDQDPSSAS